MALLATMPRANSRGRHKSRLVIIAGLLQRFVQTTLEFDGAEQGGDAAPVEAFLVLADVALGGRVAYACARVLGILGFKVVENGLQDLSATLIQQGRRRSFSKARVFAGVVGAATKTSDGGGDLVAEGLAGCGGQGEDGLELMQNGGGGQSEG